MTAARKRVVLSPDKYNTTRFTKHSNVWVVIVKRHLRYRSRPTTIIDQTVFSSPSLFLLLLRPFAPRIPRVPWALDSFHLDTTLL